MKLTNKNIRFLVVYIGINFFALIVNELNIHGNVVNEWGGIYNSKVKDINILTSEPGYFDKDSSWPFVKYAQLDKNGGTVYFRGVFYKYNMKSFVIMVLIGFSIVYIPKLWNNKSIEKESRSN